MHRLVLDIPTVCADRIWNEFQTVVRRILPNAGWRGIHHANFPMMNWALIAGNRPTGTGCGHAALGLYAIGDQNVGSSGLMQYIAGFFKFCRSAILALVRIPAPLVAQRVLVIGREILDLLFREGCRVFVFFVVAWTNSLGGNQEQFALKPATGIDNCVTQ